MTLAAAQHAIETDWVTAEQKLGDLMSPVTDVVMVFRAWGGGDAAQRFEELIAAHLERHVTPEQKEADFENTGCIVYHLGANRMPFELREALLTGPWPAGTVLLLENEATDARPVIKIFGVAPRAGWDAEEPQDHR